MKITGFPEHTGLCCEINDITLLDFAIGEIHFEPQLIANTWFEVSYQSARC